MQLPVKQLQRRPHLTAADGCFSLLSSMKFRTIFPKQTELGSNSIEPLELSLLKCGSSRTPTLSAAKLLRNWSSKSRRRRDLAAGFSRVMSSGESESIGWIFILEGMISVTMKTRNASQIQIPIKLSYPFCKTNLRPNNQISQLFFIDLRRFSPFVLRKTREIEIQSTVRKIDTGILNIFKD